MKSIVILFTTFVVLTFISCNNSAVNSDKEKSSESEIVDSSQNEKSDVEQATFTEECIVNPSVIKNGDVFNNLKVDQYIFKSDRSFGFTLIGEFDLCGELMIDEMWGELALQIKEDENPHNNIMIEYDGNKTKLMQFCYINNADELREHLSDGQIDKLKNKETISVCLRVKDFSTGGKMDGYTESRIDFVKIIEE